MSLELIPITIERKPVEKYLNSAFCIEVYEAFEQLYPEIGFNVPWIGYFFLLNKDVVGIGGFKGAPRNNTVEIAYGVIPEKEGKGYATKICKNLTAMALEEDQNLRITARTLMEDNASVKVLKKNGYQFSGVVNDPDDGDVWEWEYVNK